MYCFGVEALLLIPSVILIGHTEAFSSFSPRRAVFRGRASSHETVAPQPHRSSLLTLHSTDADLEEGGYDLSVPTTSPFEQHAREVFLTYATHIKNTIADDAEDGECEPDDVENNAILKEDLRSMLLSLDIDATAEESMALFKYLDSDGDDYVSLSEFMPWYSEACSGAQDAAYAFQDVITSRRTVHRFDETEVDGGSLRRALECAINAPNRSGTEPWRFVLLGKNTVGQVVELKSRMNKEGVLSRRNGEDALDGVGDFDEDNVTAEGAEGETVSVDGSFLPDWTTVPHWCVVTYARSPDDLTRQREDFKSVCCAVQNFMLSMWSEGIGTKWTDGPVQRTPEFAEICGIDMEKEKVAGVIWYGFAKGGLKWGTQAKKRAKGVDDVLTSLP